MNIIIYIASRVWCFFTLLGKVGMMPLYRVLSDSYILTADNPFNDFMLEVDVAVGDSLVGDVLDLITQAIGVGDYTVFEGLLFSFALLFVVNLFARLISFATPD